MRHLYTPKAVGQILLMDCLDALEMLQQWPDDRLRQPNARLQFWSTAVTRFDHHEKPASVRHTDVAKLADRI